MQKTQSVVPSAPLVPSPYETVKVKEKPVENVQKEEPLKLKKVENMPKELVSKMQNLINSHYKGETVT